MRPGEDAGRPCAAYPSLALRAGATALVRPVGVGTGGRNVHPAVSALLRCGRARRAGAGLVRSPRSEVARFTCRRAGRATVCCLPGKAVRLGARFVAGADDRARRRRGPDGIPLTARSPNHRVAAGWSPGDHIVCRHPCCHCRYPRRVVYLDERGRHPFIVTLCRTSSLATFHLIGLAGGCVPAATPCRLGPAPMTRRGPRSCPPRTRFRGSPQLAPSSTRSPTSALAP